MNSYIIYYHGELPSKIITTSFIFPIPLKNNTIVTIHNIPIDLNIYDAAKICKVIMALSS